MNLVESLISADINKAYELEKGTFKSKRLAKLLGEDEAVEIEIAEIPQRKLNEIMAIQYSNSGKLQLTKSFDAKLMSIVEGVRNPSLKDSELQKHFNAESPKKLAEILFGSEVTDLSDAIMGISGISDDKDEEIKN